MAFVVIKYVFLLINVLLLNIDISSCWTITIGKTNLSFTNNSAYFDISQSDIDILQNKQYQGYSANITIPILYEFNTTIKTKNESLMNKLISNSIIDTIKDYKPNAGDEQIQVYQISTYNISDSFKSRLYTAYLAYNITELRDINNFTLSNQLQSKLQVKLQDLVTNNGLKSIIVNKDETKINNVKIDTDDLYHDSSKSSNNDNDDIIDKDLLWIFIGVACLTILIIFCIAIWVIRKKYNNKITQKLGDLEKSLIEDSNGQYTAPQHILKGHPTSPIIEHSSRLELQLNGQKSNSMQRPKIVTYEYETPGLDPIDGSQIDQDVNDTAPDIINDEVDQYLANSDNEDSDNDDLYTLPSETPQ